jgi:hypothetical protein
MNIDVLAESTNKLFVEQDLPNLPAELAETIKMPEYSFYLVGVFDKNASYEFCNNQIYKRSESKFEKQEFTGEIYFGDVFYLDGEYDITIIYKAVFIKGILNEISQHLFEKVENEKRKVVLKKIMDNIKRRASIMKNPIFLYIYRPYAVIIFMIFWIIRHTLLFFFKGIDWVFTSLQKILLPL